MIDLLLRFVIGGLVVCAFALIGDLFKPKSFGGLFGAAPSVAIATLALAVHKDGSSYAALSAIHDSRSLGTSRLLANCVLVLGASQGQGSYVYASLHAGLVCGRIRGMVLLVEVNSC
jgi:hypothetical protein